MSIIFFKNSLISAFGIGFSKITSKNALNLLLIGFLLVFIKGTGVRNTIPLTYYPRALNAHAALGKTLNTISKKYGIKTFMLGDAGMAAFHSKLNAFDNIGLGSSAMAHDGISEKLLEVYEIDLIAFQSRPDGIRLSDYNQDIVYKWANNNNFEYLCDVYFYDDYTLKLYSRNRIPELQELCLISKRKNDVPDMGYLLDTFYIPPWRFWRE
jgi:hypothetical protein